MELIDQPHIIPSITGFIRYIPFIPGIVIFSFFIHFLSSYQPRQMRFKQ